MKRIILLGVLGVILSGCSQQTMTDAEVLERAEKIKKGSGISTVPYPANTSKTVIGAQSAVVSGFKGYAYNPDGCLMEVYVIGDGNYPTEIPLPYYRREVNTSDESTGYIPCYRSKAAKKN